MKETLLLRHIKLAASRYRIWVRGLVGVFLSLTIFLTGTSLYQRIASEQDLRTFPAPGKLIDVGGYRLHLYCTGQGLPTIIFEGGLGSSSLMWELVQSSVAVRTRACSYDRAGYGWSDPALSPRNGSQIVTDLHTLL